MQKIPVTFKLDDQEYQGALEEVSGIGSNMWYLMVSDRYWGRLWRTQEGSWHWDGNKQGLNELKEYFVDVLISYYQ